MSISSWWLKVRAMIPSTMPSSVCATSPIASRLPRPTSLPWMAMAWPPSWVMPVSKETRVRSDGFSKTIARVFPSRAARCSCGLALMRAARSRISSTSSRARSWIEIRSRLFMSSLLLVRVGHDARSGTAEHRLRQPLGRGDQHLAAALLRELHSGPDLRAHAALGELSRLQVAARFGRGHAPQRPLVLRAEAERHVLDPRQDDQQVRPDACREERRSVILVDDRLDALQQPLARAVDGDASPAGGDDQVPRLERLAEHRQLHHLERPRRRDHLAPAAPGVLDHVPAEPVDEEIRPEAGVE